MIRVLSIAPGRLGASGGAVARVGAGSAWRFGASVIAAAFASMTNDTVAG